MSNNVRLKFFHMLDLFNDGGVIKTVIRASTESRKPVSGDEVAVTYQLNGAEGDVHQKNLVYTVGVNASSLFLPLRTMDKIVCDMKRGEHSQVRVSSTYTGTETDMNLDLTLVHIRPGASTPLAPLPQSLSEYQDHILQNPDIMEQMMASPMMDSLLSNPDIMNSMIDGNPQMQELLEQNPELRSMMRDPEFIRQSMEAMRNPSMMREMMRNTDRAMSNIESLPGGSAALHKLYNEVQAPLMDATAGGALDGLKDTKVVNTNQLKAKYGESIKPKKPVSEPMVNPWVTAPRQIPTIPSASAPAAPRLPIDMSSMAQMMQNPNLQSLFGAPPAATNSSGPQGQANPFGNPAVLAELFNPNTMQAMAQLERSLGMMGGQMNGGSQGFNSLFGNFLNSQPPLNLEEIYRSQLLTLRSMGFEDTQAAIRALVRTGGNVDAAVDILILERTSGGGTANPGPSADSSSK